MANSIFDSIQAPVIATYWQSLPQTEQPYLGDALFPAARSIGTDLKWLKGATGAPIALRPSAFDVEAIPRARGGFTEVSEKMIYYKESKYIDEERRQELLRVQNAQPQYAEVILSRIMDDQTALLRGAALARELVRMQALTTGKASIVGNGQAYTVDYDLPANHIAKSKTPWSDDKSVPYDDIDNAISTIGNDTGVTVTRAVMNRKTYNTLLRNNTVKATLLANNANMGAVQIPRTVLDGYIADQFGLTIGIYDKGYQDASGKLVKFIPDGLIVFLPSAPVGNTYFGTTPAEADLMASTAANVAMVDTGVAITTVTKADPVTIETIVSQLVLPSFEQANSVYIMDTSAPAVTSSTPSKK